MVLILSTGRKPSSSSTPHLPKYSWARAHGKELAQQNQEKQWKIGSGRCGVKKILKGAKVQDQVSGRKM